MPVCRPLSLGLRDSSLRVKAAVVLSRRAQSSWSKDFYGKYESVSVPCASSGNITLGLYNLHSHSPPTPLLIYLPPFSQPPHPNSPNLPHPLPSFTERYPTAVIHYRWLEDGLLSDPIAGATDQRQQQRLSRNGVLPERPPAPLHWPTPLHDALFGYEWIKQNLSPEGRTRRDIYVYGSYLGASLAAALALTESHSHERVAVRGVALYNGVYNWTTFLLGHPINSLAASPSGRRKSNNSTNPLAGIARAAADVERAQRMEALREAHEAQQKGSTFHYLKQLVPTLFKTPSNLFDPFASPCLFFHSAGLLVPPTFENVAPAIIEGSVSSELPSSFLSAVDRLSMVSGNLHNGSITTNTESDDDPETACLETAFKAPRKGYLAFPPRQSSLKIPEALLLHEPPPPPLSRTGRRKPWRGRLPIPLSKLGAAGGEGNSFAAQAAELAGLMRRSVNMLELKERRKWDDEFDDWDHEAERRVRLAEVVQRQWQHGTGSLELGEEGEEAVARWLEERIGF